MNRTWQHSLAAPLFYGLLIVGWQTLVWCDVFPAYVLPSPTMVLRRLVELSSDGLLWPSLKATLTRMFVGFGLSVCLGLFFGLLMGSLAPVRRALRGFFTGLQTLPSAGWVPIALLFFGLQDTAIYFVIVMSSVGAVALAVSDGIAHIPPVLIKAAQTLGTPRSAMWWQVMLPSALPNMVTGLKLGWTMGWHGTVSAELIKSAIGLGFLLHMGRELSDTAQVLAIMVVTIAVGAMIDRCVFTPLERRLRLRWGLTTAE